MEFAQLAVYANLLLTWIGFGTVIGLIAKATMPGKDPGGAVAIILMGIVGTLFGCAVLQVFSASDQFIQPTSLVGFTVGAGGAIVLLAFYKALGGHWFAEGGQTIRRSKRRTRHYRTVQDD